MMDIITTTEFFQPSWDDCFHLEVWFPLEVGHPKFFGTLSLPLIQQLAYLMYYECLYLTFPSFPQIQ